MDKAHVFLREDQRAALKDIARRTGAKQSELIRKGVDLVIEESESQEADRRLALLNIFGIWRDRSDLDARLSIGRDALDARSSGEDRLTA